MESRVLGQVTWLGEQHRLLRKRVGRFKCAHTHNMLGMWEAGRSVMTTIAISGVKEEVLMARQGCEGLTCRGLGTAGQAGRAGGSSCSEQAGGSQT